jgi:archaellum biogenesis ATPase FlaH|tara:strand:+ start:649 stop:2001 length:1353 start_codon:yes stop_codon:yes gene_type:complete
MMLNDAESYVRVQNIFNAENFDKSLREPAKFIEKHTADYSTMPTADQINAATGSKLKPVKELTEGHYDWFMSEFEAFTRRNELERAILKSADLLEKGEYDPVEKLIKDAVQISLTKDLGIEYWEDPRARLMALKDGNGQVSTGWANLDKKLFGGFNRGELNIFAGGSGSGKSLFMQNLAVNWTMAGLNGVYLTLELSEGLCAMRLDSMVSEIPTKDVFKDLDTLEMKIGMAGKKAGSLRIKYMPAQSNINDIRSYIKELQVKIGKKLDYICVDYLDLLMPVSAKVSPNDQFIKDKYVSEELRNLAKEMDFIMVTASQLNRAAVEEIEFDHSHIAGGISKINTADNVIGIFTSRAMRERGRYQVQFMKTRSSSGVGQKVDLEFDNNSLRIRDCDESDSDSASASSTISTDVMNKIKAQSNVGNQSAEQPEKIVRAEVQSNKLNDMLKNLKT